MKKRWRVTMAAVLVLCVALAAVLLWPAPDPLADVETVAVRFDVVDVSTSRVDFERELLVILGERDIRIVSDETTADVVLSLTNLTVNLGDIEFSFSDGGFRGRASAVCTLLDVRTGKSHVMDFHLTIENGRAEAELVPRKFWEFWKPSPNLEAERG